jgi:hypothetical protein
MYNEDYEEDEDIYVSEAEEYKSGEDEEKQDDGNGAFIGPIQDHQGAAGSRKRPILSCPYHRIL